MSSDLQLKDKDLRFSPAPPPFQILCLSGGGYRGLYTAALLEVLEEKAGDKRLVQIFDLIAGTSIGGILAIGLAAGISARTLRESFEKNGAAIFPQFVTFRGHRVLPRLGTGMFRSRYKADGLRSTIEAVLGKTNTSRLLGDLKSKVFIASVDVTNNSPKLFGIDGQGLSTSLLDVALATSAAPTYFPEHRIDQNIYVDGGLIANAPDVIALVHSLKRESPAQIRMLSIGTVGGSGGEAARRPNRRGWLVRGKGLVDLTLAAQEKLSIELTSKFLGENYIRLDANPSAEQQKAIGLDRTDTAATDTLKALARQTAEEGLKKHQAQLREMLNRTSQLYRSPAP
jgi:uncharacterized protein